MKPALQRMFIFDFYVREHRRLPGHGIEGRKRLRKKRRAVMERWWKRLPPTRRNALIAEAERIVVGYNNGLREHQHHMREMIDEIQARIEQYKASHRYFRRGSIS